MKVQPQLNLRKAVWYSIVINALQILAMAVLAVYILIDGVNEALHGVLGDLIVLTLAAVVIWGAALDIREALNTRKISVKLHGLDETVTQMSDLNHALRAQRHDFLNHLQVVYSLMEMEEYQEANAYIEKVYGDIARVSRVLKTRNPAINALLQVKMAACEKAGIEMKLEIRSAWDSLPMEGWEMCKVLSNLIDNAMDALAEVSEKHLTVTLEEDLKAYRFRVMNNGPMIPPQSRRTIFQAGVTGKAKGHGMGLYIVRRTLEEHGGGIDVESTPQETTFTGFVPRLIAGSAQAEEAVRDAM